MLRVIRFLAGVSVTFYIAIIYKSNALIYLGFAEIVLAMLCFFYALIGFFGIFVSVEAPLGIVEAGQKVPVRIRVQNNSIFPSGKITVILEEVSLLSEKKRKSVFYTAAEGKGMKKSPAETVIMTEWSSEYVGKTEIRVKKVLCFDLLGVFALSLPKKKRRGKTEIVIMPEIYDVPVEIGNDVREFVAEQECYLQSGEESMLSDDFEIRDYRQGDRIRSIHWKISAKSDELMVRDYKIRAGCPVLLFLDIRAGEEKKKKMSQKRKGLYVVILSVSAALLKQNCSHYVIWYDEKKGDIKRCRMEKEEDIYILLRELSMAECYPKGFLPEEAYFEKYHERVFMHKLVLTGDLVLNYNEEVKILYDVEHLKESVASQEIFLG